MNSQVKHERGESKREVLGILIMAFALLVFLGLISYHHTDFPNNGSAQAVKNWLGLAGAWFGHYLYVYTIGYSCLVFPLILFLFGWNLFVQKPFQPFYRIAIALLALGLFLSTALALPEVVSEEKTRFGFRLSGLLGAFFAEHLNRYLGMVGSIVVLLTFLLIFFVTATTWSMRQAVLSFRDEVRTVVADLRQKRIDVQRRRQEQPKKKKSRIPVSESRKSPAPTERLDPVKPEPVIHQVQNRPAASASEPIRREVSRSMELDVPAIPRGPYQLPPLDLFQSETHNTQKVDRRILEEKAHLLEEKLKEFDIRGDVVGIQPGPVITRFEVRPAPGVKISRFVSSQEDLALVLKAQRVRVVAPIPGKAAVGIEIPNDEPMVVGLRSILESEAFQTATSMLTLALGQTIEGRPYVANLAQMPHLLVAGATGSGKSVCLNTIIASFLFRAEPEDVQLVLIDPKKLELSLYRKLKKHHLTTRDDLEEDVITTVGNAVSVLRSLELEMERRYRILARAGVRNIDDYNEAVKAGKIHAQEEGKSPEHFPYLILIVDELADLMVTGAREIEEPIARLAQMSRAVGIHLILATQRPSVDVITGVIKANFPSRIAFQVATKADSRTILDRNGAEKLLGRGDMLFMHPREAEPIRIHGAFISTEEVERIVQFVRQQPAAEPWKLPGFGSKGTPSGGGGDGEHDVLFEEAKRLVIRHQQGSVSLLQRRLRIGYARAGRLIDELEDEGIIGPFDGSKAREVLVDESALDDLSDQAPSEEEV